MFMFGRSLKTKHDFNKNHQNKHCTMTHVSCFPYPVVTGWSTFQTKPATGFNTPDTFEKIFRLKHFCKMALKLLFMALLVDFLHRTRWLNLSTVQYIVVVRNVKTINVECSIMDLHLRVLYARTTNLLYDQGAKAFTFFISTIELVQYTYTNKTR